MELGQRKINNEIYIDNLQACQLNICTSSTIQAFFLKEKEPCHTAWCWGNNSSGQLGDGTTTNRYSPIQVLFGNDLAP
ncbi:MAG: hypothetical protein CVU65_18010 [Deltaproteobacteria bacterium HGW-Deltaproteobacteria-22]|nr:MAG: hypothetical protein CVU65_18010 [Deltaproteobacteria bacterium HGW-Deltaproteobacteria-22]